MVTASHDPPATGGDPARASAQELVRRGPAAVASGAWRDAAEAYRQASEIAPQDAAIWLNLGVALTRTGHYPDAVTALLRALRIDPRASAAFAQLGNVFQLLKMPEEARESFRNALALGRSPVEMAAAIVFTSLEASSWSSLETDIAALLVLIGRDQVQPAPFYGLNLPWGRRDQLGAARAHAEATFRGIEPLPARAPRARGGPIRLGYVSSDFHEHATSYLIAELFERQDRARFSPFAYSYGPDDGSPMRRRLLDTFGSRFVDAREMSAAALARQVRADRIDVLIDLKGYTLYARSEVFAYRPAPIQVNFLGFPGSLGSPVYDYIIGDPVVTPIGHADGYAEQIAQLPDCYQPNDTRRPRVDAPDRAALGLPADALVFCCFNANYKISAPVFDLWCRLLREVEGSVLWLFQTNDEARRNLLREAGARHVAPERIVFAEALPFARHLARIPAADLFLDTLPVNAHTTASDALWSGVPVLTVTGETFAARVASSLVHAAGLPELATSGLQEYEQLALALAHDRARLSALRRRLHEERDRCALFDAARYARNFDALIGRMVERLDQGLAPAHLLAE
jgi:protein O-GlcNAc transferase